MTKLTMSSVCLDALNSGGVWSVSQLHERCVKNGLAVLEAQVYANMQVLASTKRIRRGPEKRTYMSLEKVKKNVPDAPVKPIPDPVGDIVHTVDTKPKRVKVNKKFDPEQIITDLTALIGPPKYLKLVGSPYVIMLDEDYTDATYIVKRWVTVLGSLSGWLWYKVGDGYMLGGIK